MSEAKTSYVPKGPTGPKMSPGEKAARTPTSAKLAIAAYCYHHCFGEMENNSHTTKNDIKNCADKACPLWPHRGWQNITGGLLKARKRENPKIDVQGDRGGAFSTPK